MIHVYYLSLYPHLTFMAFSLFRVPSISSILMAISSCCGRYLISYQASREEERENLEKESKKRKRKEDVGLDHDDYGITHLSELLVLL